MNKVNYIYWGTADDSKKTLGGINTVQSELVNGNKPIVEHLYNAIPIVNNCNAININFGIFKSTGSSFVLNLSKV